ncbi:hypothetical protein FB45DRAFT_1086302 [Roridomyces roridus]|uniref:Kelch repeat protein n=1 Tax=Roridomyces roridus TaxID=1738132 RepID=A0AAD7BLK7_9AGAR|nr:hypothetical protein FB45DRAFT_1086302 [Roridomyces roridus]
MDTEALRTFMKGNGMDADRFLKMMARVDLKSDPIRPNAPTPPTSATALFAPNAAATGRRPQNDRIQMLARNPDGLDDLCPPNTTNRATCFVRGNVFKAKAERQWAAKAYSDARVSYVQAAWEMLGVPVPGAGEVRSEDYARLGSGWDAVDMLGCINGVIACSRQLKDYITALLWVEEAAVVVKNIEIANKLESSFEWTPMQLSALPDYFFERTTSLCLAADIFLAVGNTGCAVHRRWVADEMLAFLPDRLKTSQTRQFDPPLGVDIARLRHPDPQRISSSTIEDPTLQVQGSWQKLSIRKANTLSPRQRCAVMAFDGKLYVLGGEKVTGGPYYRDFWMLDLASLSGWERLPDFLIPKHVMGDFIGYQMTPHRDGAAFVFVGVPMVAIFHLRRRKWAMLDADFIPDAQTPEWPYSRVRDYSAHCVGDKLYIFGGTCPGSAVGTDLFMELDITSKKWRRLGGSAVPKPSAVSPGPRADCSSWVSKDQKQIFFLFGAADRNAAMQHGQVHGHLYSYGYGDLWSWDIGEERWTRERMIGNVPSPRGEMALQHEALDKVVLFGGYSPTVPTWFDEMNDTVTYTYYADTFIGDMTSSSSSSSTNPNPVSWRQVLTRGFPTYRAQSWLVVDSKTGKIYLFSGYKNTTYVPSKGSTSTENKGKDKDKPKPSSRSFLDLWQLKLDVPGGHFTGVDLEEEARTAVVGPWQRCFACGSTGPWKKCGGSGV